MPKTTMTQRKYADYRGVSPAYITHLKHAGRLVFDGSLVDVEASDAVYEPFSGSGTTIIAAEQTGRRCYAMELSPQYVDVAVRRWQEFTGKQATRESDGVLFDQATSDSSTISQ